MKLKKIFFLLGIFALFYFILENLRLAPLIDISSRNLIYNIRPAEGVVLFLSLFIVIILIANYIIESPKKIKTISVGILIVSAATSTITLERYSLQTLYIPSEYNYIIEDDIVYVNGCIYTGHGVYGLRLLSADIIINGNSETVYFDSQYEVYATTRMIWFSLYGYPLKNIKNATVFIPTVKLVANDYS